MIPDARRALFDALLVERFTPIPPHRRPDQLTPHELREAEAETAARIRRLRREHNARRTT